MPASIEWSKLLSADSLLVATNIAEWLKTLFDNFIESLGVLHEAFASNEPPIILQAFGSSLKLVSSLWPDSKFITPHMHKFPELLQIRDTIASKWVSAAVLKNNKLLAFGRKHFQQASGLACDKAR